MRHATIMSFGRAIRSLVCAGLLVGGWAGDARLGSSAHAQDWSLTRKRERGPRTKKRAAKKRRRNTPAGPERAAAPGSAKAVLFSRYLKMLKTHPSDEFAFRRLAELYRERDGSLAAFEAMVTESVSDPYVKAVLAGRIRLENRDVNGARAEFARAHEANGARPGVLLLHARLEGTAGNTKSQEELLEKALPMLKAAVDRQAVIRELGELAIADAEYGKAEQFYRKLEQGGGLYLKTEYARALAQGGHHERAIQEYRRVLKKLGGDRRILAPVLRDLGRVQLEAKKTDDALSTFRRALSLTPPRSGVRVEILDDVVRAYRASDRLAELVETLSKERGGHEQQELLGRLHDEMGNEAEALKSYRSALRARPRDLETRMRVVQLLMRSGRMDESLVEHKRLVKESRGMPRFVLAHARLLNELGKRAEALRTLDEQSRKRPRDANLHRGLSELFSQWGEAERAAREVRILARIDPHDPGHLIVLGAQQLEDGKPEQAKATWRRILQGAGTKAEKHATLAQVFLDNGMVQEAVVQFKAAVKLAPKDVAVRRGYATALEQTSDLDRAMAQWREVIEQSPKQRVSRREARKRIVNILFRQRKLKPSIRAWKAQFDAAGDDSLSAGKLAVSGIMRLGPKSLPDADALLEKMVDRHPGDVELLLTRERVQLGLGRVEQAIQTLSRLVDADPRSGSQYLQRMAEHALSIYKDDDAVRYASLAVERSPTDAHAHKRLGELYRARQQIQKAAVAFERAIGIDHRLFSTYFELADLQLSMGKKGEAERLYRDVITRCPDDELVAQAARAAIRLAVASGDMKGLEDDLLPMSLKHTTRPIFRRALVTLYDSMAAPWIESAERGGPGADEAVAQLRDLGARAIKPLLEALVDSDPAQQGVAVSILAYLANPKAAAPLIAAAEGEGASQIRARALIASGAVAPVSMAPRFLKIAQGDERRLSALAVWSLARLGAPASSLRPFLTHSSSSVRMHAALGLGLGRHRAAAPALLERLRADRSTHVRAAAAWALGEFSGSFPQREAALDQLAISIRDGGSLLVRAATLALGRLSRSGAEEALNESLAFTLLDMEPQLRESAQRALLGAYVTPTLPVIGPSEGVADYLNRFLDATVSGEGGAEQYRKWSSLRPLVVRAVGEALRGPIEQASTAMEVLSDPDMLSWVPGDHHHWREQVLRAVAADLESIHNHPVVPVRTQALSLLALIPGSERVVVDALREDEAEVVRAVLNSIAEEEAALPSQVITSVCEVLAEHQSWSVRVAAARALGRAPTENAKSTEALIDALEQDPYAFVREAAAKSLKGRRGSSKSLKKAAKTDPEPQVRRAAAAAP